jgi:hypothetical protein
MHANSRIPVDLASERGHVGRIGIAGRAARYFQDTLYVDCDPSGIFANSTDVEARCQTLQRWFEEDLYDRQS